GGNMCGFVFYSGIDLKVDTFAKSLEKIGHRGPDDTEVVKTNSALLGFKRLAIMDLGHAGDQPFKLETNFSICNGEIYNYKELKEKTGDYVYKSGSDCEVLLPYFQK